MFHAENEASGAVSQCDLEAGFQVIGPGEAQIELSRWC